ncbi:SDR family NAD(P)-dependent oxidoreductase [Pusillimonas noertemannii]|uniref:Short-subunit dehydrogenase n=1 Tax=Pusillimonas noertemannii TaxID=305977 RepID=A0A2U1CQY3_9BURK|nr:SDR family NAD(P)-dependent oxidoreductase [Pusillimonas noertemannii]NYT67570.1 SDR family NAD(P)-dependent oxidoreductase [Pusillimonas noertemannii]PVY68244.1 short-subunit dehydrogenase [Pusillimonas noertemannii]TFL12262.1 SDR family NAD(P)-dependent oxidoreductase [Pusillimonas noertemannii]
MQNSTNSPSKRRDVAGATIVVTGASSGFGRGAALKLAAQGANVVLGARRAAALEALAAEIESAGGSALAIGMDVSNARDVGRLAQAAVQRFGRFDVWINNVGIGALGLFWDIPIEDHARVIDVNLKGLIYGAHVALRQFREQGFGTLINMGSIDSEVPLAYQTSYAASKAAVLSLGRSLREELRLAGNEDIKVGTIMPWAVDTPWWTHAANYTGHEPRMLAMDDPEIVIDAIVRACVEPKEEMPVGWISHASNVSHHIFPDLTERMSANIAHREVEKASPLAPSTGAIYQPMTDTATIDGGIRARMKREDDQDGPSK